MKNKTILAAALSWLVANASVETKDNNINSWYDSFNDDTVLLVNNTKDRVDKISNFKIITAKPSDDQNKSATTAPTADLISVDGFEAPFVVPTDINLVRNQNNSIDLFDEFMWEIPANMSFVWSNFEWQDWASLPPITEYDPDTSTYSWSATENGTYDTTYTATFEYLPTGDNITYVNDNQVTVSESGWSNNNPPTLTYEDQTVYDNWWGFPTTLPELTTTNVQPWAIFSIENNPLSWLLSIDIDTWTMVFDWNLNSSETFPITLKVVNPSNLSDTITFNLTVINNF